MGIKLTEAKFRRGDRSYSFDFTIGKGEWLSVVGPSGSGKTTLLEGIAGFLPIDSGNIEILGRDVKVDGPDMRPVAYIFQRSNLFPHLNVRQNLEFANCERNPGFRSKMNDVLRVVGLGADFLSRIPATLSGGEEARVNIARALLLERPILLLDEAFSALDHALRITILRDVMRIHREHGLTTVHVTHNLDDALIAADWVLKIDRDGKNQIYDKKSVRKVDPFKSFMIEIAGLVENLAGK